MINSGAAGATVVNGVSGTADVLPAQCAPAVVDRAAVLADPASCSTTNPTTIAPVVHKEVRGPPVWDAGSGEFTVEYAIGVTNPNADAAIPYTLTDVLDFGPGIEVRSAGVTAPDGVTLAAPAWNGFSATLILDGAPKVWRTEYGGFFPGNSIAVGEESVVPADCVNAATGVGSFLPATALGSEKVTNVVTCQVDPLPPAVQRRPPFQAVLRATSVRSAGPWVVYWPEFPAERAIAGGFGGLGLGGVVGVRRHTCVARYRKLSCTAASYRKSTTSPAVSSR